MEHNKIRLNKVVIEAIIKKKKMSYFVVALLSGCSRDLAKKYLEGTEVPKQSFVEKLSKFLGVPREVLLIDENNQSLIDADIMEKNIVLNRARISLSRFSKKISLEDIASKTGVSPEQVKSYEEGEQPTNLLYVFQLAEILELTVEELIGEQTFDPENIRLNLIKENNGCCHLCNEFAPFKSNDGIPFLKLFSLTTEEENSVLKHCVLCPNCHAKMVEINPVEEWNYLATLRL